jgi:flagellar hook-basal body complex protein FliE
MMKPTISNAISAYNDAAKRLGAPGLEAPGQGGPSFAELLKDTAQGAIDTGKAGEQQSIAAVAQQAELADIITAVSNAEVTLQTVVAVRDRVISAYQEIMRMPM